MLYERVYGYIDAIAEIVICRITELCIIFGIFGRTGATGIILKEHPKEFEKTLISITNSATVSLANKRSVKRMARYVYELINDSCYVRQLENIRDICKELDLRLN